MSKIGIGDPSTRLKVNFMECKWTTHQTSMMNGMKKNRGIYKPTERAGTSVKDTVKTKLEIVEVAIY